MDTVFLLWHVHPLGPGEDDEKLIGVYRSRGAAEAAIARVGIQPGFKDCPEGFQIHEYHLDKDGWEEGYVTVP